MADFATGPTKLVTIGPRLESLNKLKTIAIMRDTSIPVVIEGYVGKLVKAHLGS